MKPEKLARIVDKWNKKHPVGTPVVVLEDGGANTSTFTTSLAFIECGHSAVIQCDRISGNYRLDRVMPDVRRESVGDFQRRQFFQAERLRRGMDGCHEH